MKQRTHKPANTDLPRGGHAGGFMPVTGVAEVDACWNYGFEGIEESAALLHDVHDDEQEQRLGLACRSRVKSEAIVGYVVGSTNRQPGVDR